MLNREKVQENISNYEQNLIIEISEHLNLRLGKVNNHK